MLLQFKPPRRIRTEVGRAKIWQSVCGNYRVRESRIAGLTTIFYAQVKDGETWDVISQHRGRKAAEAACEKHARKSTRKVKR